MIPVAIRSVATASPPYVLHQEEVAEAARRVFEPRFKAFERLMPVFTSAGIRTRQAVRPMDWYVHPRGWPQRTEAYIEGATQLFINAARAALDEAGLKGRDVDVIVTVSSTGIATPSLEARAMEALGFRPDAARIPVFGLGCAGGASGVSIAARFAAATPGAVVLVVAVEVCTLAAQRDELTKANIVATALFGDGAAAVVLQAGGEGFAQITGLAEHTWPQTLNIMGWRADPDGLGVIFDRDIPPFAEANIRPAMQAMLATQDIVLGDVGRFVCHPGGTKVLEALESALALGQGALDLEREVLTDHGNMSSPTVLFVLDRARRRGLPSLAVVSGLGPGFTCSTVTLRQAA
jgi:alkylresorcinol/alkylpyrone synthase